MAHICHLIVVNSSKRIRLSVKTAWWYMDTIF